MSTATVGLAAVVRRRLVVRGVVQGVGFRPFLARLAHETGVTGACRNDVGGVVVEVQGDAESVERFAGRLVADAPPLARILSVVPEDLEVRAGESGFGIDTSTPGTGPRTLVPPDTATCDACLAELLDPTDRRYRHPFITCTGCGPRLTIVTGLPYDRPATTMSGFPMCAACAAEYADPADRRYHAQPVACHDCGPTLVAEAVDGSRAVGTEPALALARRALLDGGVVAVKGLGGYHLACDAADAQAVARLRDRKARPHKPFALMVADAATARALVDLDDTALALLTGPERPIVVAPRRSGAPVAAAVAPGLDDLGVLLPYTPVHHLLLAPDPATREAAPPVLVMTSGNRGEEPLCFEDDDARERLGSFADVFLTHDRPVHVPCEDSLVVAREGRVTPVRRSRGHAPLPVAVPPGPTVLAVGAEVKNTFCLAREDLAFVSAHLGDMGTLESRRAFERSVDQLLGLHGSVPELIAADLHPGYSTRHLAERWATDRDLPLHLVQHHHAHLASLLAEHGRLGEPVVGVAFDGTGHGCDGTIWGGEVLVVGADVARAERVGHLAEFALPGGDAAVRAPVRTALALLDLAGLRDDAPRLLRGLSQDELAAVGAVLDRPGAAPRTTSLGRLVDGLAALLGVRDRVSYEAQAAVELEVLARTATRGTWFDVDVTDGVLDTAGLVRGVVGALRAGADRAEIARGVHDALVDSTARCALAAAEAQGASVVGLTGGAFQNHLLAAGLVRTLEGGGVEVLTHHVVPCTDGGLSLGQAVVARAAADRPEGA